MATYKERVTIDLDRWIAAGLVPAASRDAVLATLPDSRRLDAATALAWVGAILLSFALIALVGANWGVLPRVARFGLVLTVFAGAAGAAAWCSEHARPILANVLLTVSALVFAAAIGLTGQIFSIVGDTRAALYAAGVVAAGLALAGRASGPAVVSVLFFAAADFWPDLGTMGAEPLVPWSAVIAPAAAALALRWRSIPLAHAAAVALAALAIWAAYKAPDHDAGLLAASVVLTALAFAARHLRERGRAAGGVLCAWLLLAALGAFIDAGIFGEHEHLTLAHRIVWLLLAGGLVALGRHDRQTPITAAGVVGLLGAVGAILLDLGVNLMAAAAVFFGAAVLAAAAGFTLRRRAQ
jgi:uncharacterized membrane protein